ncbi:MAG: efflux RND transporter permease subunit [Planctomycetes bacterium]|nr:efflux RND transporter permease subunit [Planctomycetota bacterium]
MQRLAEICIRRPVFAAMLILALVVVGAAGYLQLGVDRFPSVDLPQVSVRTNLPGAAPEEVESTVSQRIEEAVNTIEGIAELRSISGQGTSIILLTFELERDIETATQDVRDRVASVRRQLPRDALEPIVSKFDNDSSPVLSIAVSGDRPLRELTEFADKEVKIPLEQASGVGEVRMVGGLERAIHVWVDAERLAAYRLPITAVRDAIQRQNADIPGGNVTSGARESQLRTMGRITDPREFDDLVVANVDGAPIRVRDVGRAEDGTKEQRSTSRLDGTTAVVLEVRRQSGANTVAVIDAVKERLERLRPALPRDLRLEVIRDQSRYIHAAQEEITVHLVVGSLLASLMVLLFMRNLRATVIAAVAIPTSVIATFGMMWALDFTLNSVTMLALVLMVGVVIDDAIVVLENIFRFVEEKRMAPFQAAKAATAEIGLAVLATTLSLVVIFVPVSFMSSISGRFLFQFGLTAAVAVLVSLLVSFTLTPTMSARWLRPADVAAAGEHAVARSRRGLYGLLERGYMALLAWCMRRRWLVAAVALLVCASSVPLYDLVRLDYLPSNVDEAEFDVNVTAPEGASLAAMDQAMLAVEDELRQVPGIRLLLTSVGGSFLGGVNQGSVYVRIAPHAERLFSPGRLWDALLAGDPLAAFRDNYSQRDVMMAVRRRLARFSDLRCSVRNARSFNLGGGNFEIDFTLRGPDLLALAQYGETLRRRARELGGILDGDITLKLEMPELRVEIDRERAADLGVATEDVALALRLMVGGDQEVSRFHDLQRNEDYDVQIRLLSQYRASAEEIARLYVPRRGGELVRLDNLVRFSSSINAARIDRIDRQRMVALRASVGPGFALADRLEALQGAVREMNLPPAYTTTVGGRGRELARTYYEFGFAFALSLALMYMILAAQFESVVHPVTILASLPLSVPFALLSLLVTGNTLNLYSALGVLVLFGVVKKNAILQIDHMNQLRERGMPRLAAILQGNRDRLRPILMTTLALVAGMLPLALGAGPGAEERRAVAVVVIGGQTLSLLLTLLVTPVLYSLFDDLRGRRRIAGPEGAA